MALGLLRRLNKPIVHRDTCRHVLGVYRLGSPHFSPVSAEKAMDMVVAANGDIRICATCEPGMKKAADKIIDQKWGVS